MAKKNASNSRQLPPYAFSQRGSKEQAFLSSATSVPRGNSVIF
ncbi:hypothetical protein [uncultured Victivallis sp.]|nr:hypothetical protein [uncultured Victivallis sp.]